MLRSVAITLLLAFAPQVLVPAVARAEDAPIYLSPVPSPEKQGPLVWMYEDAKRNGYWLSDDQVKTVAARIWKLQAERDAAIHDAAEARVERDIAKGKGKIPTWVWISAATVAGLVGGFFGKRYIDGGGGSTAAPVTTTTQPPLTAAQ